MKLMEIEAPIDGLLFLLISIKFTAVLRKINFLKNPRWRPRWRTCCEMTVAIAAVLN